MTPRVKALNSEERAGASEVCDAGRSQTQGFGGLVKYLGFYLYLVKEKLMEYWLIIVKSQVRHCHSQI